MIGIRIMFRNGETTTIVDVEGARPDFEQLIAKLPETNALMLWNKDHWLWCRADDIIAVEITEAKGGV